jgi:hypothetical protein
MKYLAIILTIVCAVTLASLFLIWPEQQTEISPAIVTINGKAISRDAIASYKGKDQHHGAQRDFIDEIITKYLLIEEAQRLGLDKDPDFRAALKTFYEHSLIKTLMERVESEIQVEVTENEIDLYLDSVGRIFTFYTYKPSPSAALATIKKHGSQHISAFEDLGETLQLALVSLKPGQSIEIFLTGNEKIAVYLESVSARPKASQLFDRGPIKQMLLASKKEIQTNKWIESLRSQASISYNEEQKLP